MRIRSRIRNWRKDLAFPFVLLVLLNCPSSFAQPAPWVRYAGVEGPGKDKHVVLIAGDEEYRSEESLPMLGKILSVRHGFDCTVLFSIDPKDGTIDPMNSNNIPGLRHLADADMMVIATRFRELPDADMKHIVQFVDSGRPILGMRTATHAFKYSRHRDSPYANYDFQSSSWPGGFGQQVLGETWVDHHGHHKHESTRGVVNPEWKHHPILRGVENVWGPTDVYLVRNLPPEANVLMFGQVLEGMDPNDRPLAGRKNNPMMPIFWTRSYTGAGGNTSRIICTTMGSSTDLRSEGLRRAIINACYWGIGLQDAIPARSNVDIVGTFHPTDYGFGTFQRGVTPAEHRLPSPVHDE